MITKFLKWLLKNASTETMPNKEKSDQRKSFAYGNTKLSNDNITREIIESEAAKTKPELLNDN